ncbi:MAG: single-stranded-DNA-specific exonuclease RecJ [Puniceicoccaceae bacterium TMED149]|nr:MAG: single-stranded-DNA-specific exonuclease RecJ [Puniceicoccaceae bacterium TMED149]
MEWVVESGKSTAVEDLSQALGISSVLAHLLYGMGFKKAESASSFLNPTLQELSDPFEITNLKSGVERLSQSIDAKERIFIFGDYDVDGITSIVQLISILRLYGMNPGYCVPFRLSEGYGLTRDAIDRALSEGKPDLMLVVDCGTNSQDILSYLKELGISVIVIDHHKLTKEFPDSAILINPHVNDREKENAPWFELSAAGLVFKFLHGLIKYRRDLKDSVAYEIKLSQIIDLAGMGTISDLVPLVGENRILSRYGLKHIQSNQRMGIVALLEESGVESSFGLSGSDISYRLGPRINASGRLGDASLPVELLLTEDRQFAKNTARSMNQINLDRQTIQHSISDEAEVMIKEQLSDSLGFVLASENWHPGVVGIVASRLSHKYNKPCIILGREEDFAKGSGRSVPGVDLVAVMKKCHSLLEQWGGHPMAVGLTLQWDQLAFFKKAFNESLMALYPKGLPEPVLTIACWLDCEEVNRSLLEEVHLLQPFGQRNPEPVFGIRNVFFEEAPKQFGKTHQKFFIQKKKSKGVLEGVAWNRTDLPDVGVPVDLAVRLEWNVWRNKKSLRLSLVDWKKSIM